MAKERQTPLNKWIKAQLDRLYPDGLTAHALTALARQRHSKTVTSVDVSNALHELAVMGTARPGPWLKTNGEPAPKPSSSGCVRKWYAQARPPVSLTKASEQ